jgi:hypothetical protein
MQATMRAAALKDPFHYFKCSNVDAGYGILVRHLKDEKMCT